MASLLNMEVNCNNDPAVKDTIYDCFAPGSAGSTPHGLVR